MTIQGQDVLNLQGFRYGHHDALVLDNLVEWSFVLKFRALLQANVDMHMLGESATGIYSYRQMFSGTYFCREPSATWRETDLVSPWQTCPSFTWQCELCAPGKRRHPLGAGRGIILRVVGRSPLPLVLTHCNCPKGESVPATAVPVGFRAFRGGV